MSSLAQVACRTGGHDSRARRRLPRAHRPRTCRYRPGRAVDSRLRWLRDDGRGRHTARWGRPEPVGHAFFTAVAFLALASWTALAGRRGATVPFTVRPRIGVGVAAVLLGLVGRTGAELALDGPAIGLWEAGGGRCRLRLATGVHSRGAYCPPFEWCRPPPTVARSSWAASAGRGRCRRRRRWRRGHDLGLLDRSAVRLRRRERIRPRVRFGIRRSGCRRPTRC